MMKDDMVIGSDMTRLWDYESDSHAFSLTFATFWLVLAKQSTG